MPYPAPPPGSPPSEDKGPKLLTYGTERQSVARRIRRRVPWLKDLLLLAAVPIAIIGYNIISDSGSAAPREQGDLPSMVRSPVRDPGATESLVAVPEDEVEGAVGSEILLAVRATGFRGVPMTDALVQWRVDFGEGSLVEDSTQTDAEGLARTSLLLPAEPGEMIVVGVVADTDLPPVRFHVTVLPGVPSEVMAVRGDQQTGPPGGLLAQPLHVRVTDQDGNPVRGVEIRFQVLSGEGMVAPTRTRTDSLGEASARWRLGSAPGTQQVAALAPEADDAVVTFAARAGGAPTQPAPAQGPPTTVAGQNPTPEEPEVEEEDPAPEPVTVARRAYSVGGGYVCVLVGGRPRCRGANDRGQGDAGPGTDFLAVAGGVSHVCALDGIGRASCWGANEAGQLGDGSRSDRASASQVDSDLRFSSLSAGLSHTCGVGSGGMAACWGRNLNGQLGDGTRDDRTTPRTVAGGVPFRRVSSGWHHTCGLGTDNRAYCWGLNAAGQLGDGSRLDRLVPTRVAGAFSVLSAGSAHTCGISGDQILCWGDNSFGQLGDGTLDDRTRPVRVQGLPGPPIRLAAGAVHTCALIQGGQAFCWGQNLHGQLGDGTTQNQRTPTAVAGGLEFTSLYAGGALTCGFSASGPEYCWGLNQSGQIGDGTRTNRSTPTQVGG